MLDLDEYERLKTESINLSNQLGPVFSKAKWTAEDHDLQRQSSHADDRLEQWIQSNIGELVSIARRVQQCENCSVLK